MRGFPWRAPLTAACSLTSAAALALTSSPAGAFPAHATGVDPTQASAHGLVVGDDGVRVVPDTSRTLQDTRRATGPVGRGGGLPADPDNRRAATLPGLTELPAGGECPAGTTKLSTQLSESFEKGSVPEPADTQGWSVLRGQARTGSYSARSVISSTDRSTQPTTPPYWALAMPLVKVPGGRTILRFAIKGNYPSETAYIAVNDESGWATPTSVWGTVALDVTSALKSTDDGWLDVRFANYPARPATNSTIDIDDVEVYTCTGASRVRGDFDADGIGDVLTVDGGGALKIWPGTGGMRLGTARQVGHGWGAMNWLGSPGDLNGDGRADLMARNRAGELFAYWGDGAGGFSLGATRVGTGWQTMTSIVPMGDINGDGFVDVLATDGRTGDLRRYWFTAAGSPMTGGTVVGTSFNSFRQLLTMGDYNGDGRWDVVGILPNGDMRVYDTLATGSLYGHGARIGTGWTFSHVSAPASFNGDGYPDVLGLDTSGRLWTYPNLGQGRWGARVLTGTYFGQFSLIL